MIKINLKRFGKMEFLNRIKQIQRSLFRPKRGITLVELVVVVMILGTLIWIFTANITSSKENLTKNVNKLKLITYN